MDHKGFNPSKYTVTPLDALADIIINEDDGQNTQKTSNAIGAMNRS